MHECGDLGVGWGGLVAVVVTPCVLKRVLLRFGEVPGESLLIWIGCVAETQDCDWREGFGGLGGACGFLGHECGVCRGRLPVAAVRCLFCEGCEELGFQVAAHVLRSGAGIQEGFDGADELTLPGPWDA